VHPHASSAVSDGSTPLMKSFKLELTFHVWVKFEHLLKMDPLGVGAERFVRLCTWNISRTVERICRRSDSGKFK
jgi:hypothetical protein